MAEMPLKAQPACSVGRLAGGFCRRLARRRPHRLLAHRRTPSIPYLVARSRRLHKLKGMIMPPPRVRQGGGKEIFRPRPAPGIGTDQIRHPLATAVPNLNRLVQARGLATSATSGSPSLRPPAPAPAWGVAAAGTCPEKSRCPCPSGSEIGATISAQVSRISAETYAHSSSDTEIANGP